jgi:hypothetical protein
LCLFPDDDYTEVATSLDFSSGWQVRA